MKTLLEATYLMKNKIEELEKKDKLTLEEKGLLKQLFSNIVLSVNSEVYVSPEIIKETHVYYYSKLNELLLKETETPVIPEPEPDGSEVPLAKTASEEIIVEKKQRKNNKATK